MGKSKVPHIDCNEFNQESEMEALKMYWIITCRISINHRSRDSSTSLVLICVPFWMFQTYSVSVRKSCPKNIEKINLWSPTFLLCCGGSLWHIQALWLPMITHARSQTLTVLNLTAAACRASFNSLESFILTFSLLAEWYRHWSSPGKQAVGHLNSTRLFIMENYNL